MMDTVKNATEVFNIVTAELKTLKALPDLDPLQRGRVLAQLCAVAMQAIAQRLVYATDAATEAMNTRSSEHDDNIEREPGGPPPDERKLQNNFGTGAVEAAEVWQRPRRRPTDRGRRSSRVSENPRRALRAVLLHRDFGHAAWSCVER